MYVQAYMLLDSPQFDIYYSPTLYTPTPDVMLNMLLYLYVSDLIRNIHVHSSMNEYIYEIQNKNCFSNSLKLIPFVILFLFVWYTSSYMRRTVHYTSQCDTLVGTFLALN